MSFGRKINEIRKEELKITLEELSKRTELSKGYLSKLENDIRDIPRLDTLIKLSKGLEISIIEMLDLAGYKGEERKIINDAETILKDSNIKWTDITNRTDEFIVPVKLHEILKEEKYQVQYGDKYALSHSDKEKLIKFIETFIIEGDE